MTDYCSLATFLCQPRTDARVCTLNTDQTTKTYQQWNQRFHQWRRHLKDLPHTRWALYDDDCFEFSTVLFALWSLKKKVYLPGNNQPGHLQALAPHVDAFVGSIAHKQSILPPAEDDSTGQKSTTENTNLPLSMTEELLYVFTSGSTGEPQAIAKTLGQISAELDTLHQQWGHQLSNIHLLSSVSHQHIYGLLFRCLWPLMEGWSFDARARQYTETFTAPPNTDALLISSPTHLSRLPLGKSTSTLTQVFSSGAPLDYPSSRNAEAYFQCPITEVLGSSETGGIAWRQQKTQTQTPWTRFDCVEFSIAPPDNRLQIRSPYLRDASQWFKSNDSASPVNNEQFLLTGRTDRIIKLEGKRLSLDEMEAQLKQHPRVLDAHLICLDQNQNRLGAIVCVAEPPAEGNGDGNSADYNAEKRHLTNTLKAHLLTHFERPTLPKKWRYLDRLPRNSQGKLNFQELMMLFNKTQDKPSLPIVLSSQDNDGGIVLTLKVPRDLRYFDGHFDQSPILPGVVQLQWAERYARERFQLNGDFVRLEALKFQKIATPGITLTLELSFSEKNKKILFKYTSSVGQHASGRIVLAS